MEAVKTIDPKQATGKLYSLWVNFAKFYEDNAQIVDARIIFQRATEVTYVKVDDLASVWCEWAEMEIRHKWVRVVVVCACGCDVKCMTVLYMLW